MPPLKLQHLRRLPTLLAAHQGGLLRALLVAAIPGALLLCILHCVTPAHAYHDHSHGASLFICNHLVEDGGTLPSLVNTSLVQNLIQGLAQAGLFALGSLALLHLAIVTPRTWVARLGERPLVPPPRPAASSSPL
jgi:hypothetical protein